MSSATAAIDVTDVYWRFVDLIVEMDYVDLQRTQLFEFMGHCVVMKREFILHMHDNTVLAHPDVNALFYNTLSFLELRGYTQLASRLQKAITKIESIVDKLEEQDDAKYPQPQSPYVAELNDLLSGLSL